MSLTDVILGWLIPPFQSSDCDAREREASAVVAAIETERKQTVGEIIGLAALEDFGGVFDHREGDRRRGAVR